MTAAVKMGRPPTKPIVRFLQKVRQEGECWVWTGTANRGYGHFWHGSGRVYAHRWSYEYHRAEIPEGLFIDHLCGNTLCVNPWHLEPVTMQVNTLRSTAPAARNATKTHCKHGHEFTPENTIPVPGGRQCRECRQQISKRHGARRIRNRRKAQ